MIVGLAMILGAFPAAAQDATAIYPNRAIRILVPYAPGGVADIAARLIGLKLTDQWKQSVIVENRTGGGGTIAADAAAKAAPDGYTLLMATVADYTMYPTVYPKLPYSVQRDLTPVVFTSDTPMMWVANAGAPFNTVAELIAYAKSQPAGVSYSSPAQGSINHLIGEQFALETGAKLVHVPYKGGAPAATAVVTGELPLGMVAASSAAPHIKSGRMKPIAVTSAKRMTANPEWPTINESVPGIVGTNWTALAAPAATPKELIAKLNVEINRILKLPDVIERFLAVGSEPGGGSSEELGARFRDETARFAKLIADAKLKLE